MQVDFSRAPALPAILAVDDHLVQLQILKAVLVNEYHVYTARSGLEAIRFLDEITAAKLIGCLHAVLLDVSMPELNGMAVLELIRTRYQTLPVIICSAHNEIDVIMNAKQRGASDYLLKPYRPEVLREKLQKYTPTARNG